MNIDLPTAPDLLARFALVVYTDDAQESGVVMRHELTECHGRTHLSPGIPVTRSTIETLMRLNAIQTLTFIPPHVIAIGVGAIAWVQEPCEQTLLFQRVSDPAVAELDGQRFPQPRLLFIAKGQQLFVYALRGTTRPEADTPLCAAPYYNIFGNHQVCTGNMVRPAEVTPAQTTEHSEGFFRSNFTHLSGGSKRWTGQFTYRELWDAARAAGAFCDDWLVPAGLTVAQAIGGGV